MDQARRNRQSCVATPEPDQDHGLEQDKRIIPLVNQISHETGIPLVATNDSHYLRRDDARAHEILMCIQTFFHSRVCARAPRRVETPKSATDKTLGSVCLPGIHFLAFMLTVALTKPYVKGMEVQLTPDQEACIRQAIETGRFQREEDVVREALSLFAERERKRAEFLQTLDDAKASLARGEGRNVTQQSMRDLAEEVKQRGLARLAAEQPAPR